MQWVVNCLSGFLALLCRMFGVTPEKIAQEKERNPSPTRPER